MLVRDVKPGKYFTLKNKLLGSPAFIKLAKYQPNNYNIINCSSWAVGHVDDNEEISLVCDIPEQLEED